MADHQKPAADSAAALNKRKKPGEPFDSEARERKINEQMAQASQLFPDEREALLAVAMHAIEAGHAAVLAGDRSAREFAWNRYRAVVWKLNGRTFFGCNNTSSPDAGGVLVEQHCRAEPGAIPMWGQAGEFVIEHAGVRALVWYESWHGIEQGHFQFYAVDLDRPFISTTGYRSHFAAARDGMTVDQVAIVEFADHLDNRRRYLDPDYQDRLAEQALPEWMDALPCRPRRPKGVHEDAQPLQVPPGFALVDAVLTEHQAFQVRKWAEAAAAKLEAARAKVAANSMAVARAKLERAKEEKPNPSPAIQPAESAQECRRDEPGERHQRLRDTVQASAGVSPLMVPYELPTWSFEPGSAFGVGTRCRVERVLWKSFLKEVGTYIIITKVHPDTRQVWAHADKPVTYRRNARGRLVVDIDPRCIENCYSMDDLTIQPQETTQNDRSKYQT